MNYNADAMESFITEKGIEGDMGAKDQYMAESIDWFLKNSLGKKIIFSCPQCSHSKNSGRF